MSLAPVCVTLWNTENYTADLILNSSRVMYFAWLSAYRSLANSRRIHKLIKSSRMTGQSQARVKPESNTGSRPESIRSHLLNALTSAPLSKSKLAAALGHKSISGTLNTHIREMLAEGLIEYIIPGKPNSRLQKYRLTAKGKEQLSWMGSLT